MQRPWWERLPSRLLEEEAALQRLRLDDEPALLKHSWERADGDLRLFAQIRAADRLIDLEVRFPAHYPEGCPSVRPVPAETRFSTHQFKNSGILCLELGPDNWHPSYMAADLLLSAWRLVLLERISEFAPIEIPSRHVASLAERVRATSNVLLRSSEFDSRLVASKGGVEFDALWLPPHYQQVLPASFPKDMPLVTPPGPRKEGLSLPARLVELSGDDPTPSEVTDDPTVLAALVEASSGSSLGDQHSLILLRWPGGETRSYLWSKAKLWKLEDVPLGIADVTRSPREQSARASAVRIAIVGLGSIGSKVAVSLARSGVRRFVLVDGDVMLGENVCRHQATFRDVGVLKVDVATQLIISAVATDPEVRTFPVDLGAATNPEYHATIVEELASCDLLVDATASPDAFNLLAGVASDHRRPLVWAEVFGGGLGGLVGSAHPERGPCPRCVRAGFLALARAWPSAPYAESRAAYGAEDNALVAIDADVGLVSAALTLRIWNLLVGDESVLPSVLLIGLRRGWIFDTAMQTVPVHVRTDDWSCARCWKRAADPEAASSEAAENLLESQVHAHD